MIAIKPVLLIEDDPNDVDLTLAALAEHNLAANIEVLRDGVQALDYLHRRGNYQGRPEGQPAVVLLDIKMPKVDGLEVLRQIRASEQLKLVPVVMLTSSREDRDVARCYQLGVNAFVVKPVGFESFRRVVKEVGVFWATINEPPPAAGAPAN